MSSDSTAEALTPFRGLTCRELAKAIFDAEVPEQFIQSLPAQSLYMVIKHNGLLSSADVIMAASIEQLKALLDFDLWTRDVVSEDSIWQWLEVTDSQQNLEALQKVLKAIDLKIIALIISRYVQVEVFDEATEQPPGPGFHTPDKGFTWIGIGVEDAHRHFLLARLLALIFETSAELFYQLLSTPGVATGSVLEEESFQERTKRLAELGVPDGEHAAEVNGTFSVDQAIADLERGEKRHIVENIYAVEPLLYEHRATKLVAKLSAEIRDRDEFEAEFTYLMNAAVVHWGVDFADQEGVLLLADKVKGAINIGLEKVVERAPGNLFEIYQALGLGKLYRIGLSQLMSLRREALKLSAETLKKIHEDQVVFSVIASARELFPEMPLFLNDDGSTDSEGGALVSGQRAIETMQAVNTIKKFVTDAPQKS